jgi:uncharacterized NAD(P)/FAD-binding protein YdhS
MSFGRQVLAIVGGGSIATSALRQLAQEIAGKRIRPFRKVLIFEANDCVGAGLAYQDDSKSNLLNTRAESMSPLPSDPGHFMRWLVENETRWRPFFQDVVVDPDAFLPRALFGLYLRYVHEESVAILANEDIEVQHVRSQIEQVSRIGSDLYELHAESALRYLADAVILATGNHESTAWDTLRQYKGYFSSPYPCNQLVNSICKDQSVCILGTSLSAIDAAVSLTDAGHQGKIIMASRNGRLPSVRGERNRKHAPNALSRERVAHVAKRNGGCLTLETVFSLLMMELRNTDSTDSELDSILRPNAGPQRYIDCEVEDASRYDRVWQAIIYGLNESIDLIWHYLSTEDRSQFEQKFKSRWLAYRVSFPIENARKIQNLLHSDQLTVHGGVEAVWHDETQRLFGTQIHDLRRGFRATLLTNCVVNSTGYTADVSRCRSGLVNHLIASGMAAPHPFGGLKLDFARSELISADGRRVPKVYVLGSLATGTYFWTNAMNVNVRLATGVVRAVLSELLPTDPEARLARAA